MTHALLCLHPDPNKDWQEHFNGKDKFKYLLMAGGVFNDITVKEIKVHAEEYNELPLRNKELETWIIVIDYQGKELELTFVWKYIDDREYYGVFNFYVDGYRKSPFETDGKSIKDVFGLLDEEENQFLDEMYNGFDAPTRFFEYERFLKMKN